MSCAMSCMTARGRPEHETHSQEADGCGVSGTSRLTPKHTGNTHRIDVWRTFEEPAPESLAPYDAVVLMGGVAMPDEVASTIVHLALDATAVTGIDIAVDVGYKAS